MSDTVDTAAPGGVPGPVVDAVPGGALSVAAALWPGADVVAAGRRSDTRPVRARFAVVQRRGGPATLVPVETARAAGTTLRRVSAAAPLATTLGRVAAAQAVRRAPALLRQRIEVRGGGPSLTDHLGEVLGLPVHVALAVGSARVNQKPVLQVFGPDGACRGFAKVGWSESTCADVLAEGDALDSVAACSFDRLRAPGVVARTEWGGRPVLVTEPLLPSPWQLRSRPDRPPVAAMTELFEQFAGGESRLDGSTWWRRQWMAAGDLGEPVLRGRMSRVLDRMSRHIGDVPVRWGAWHGDWTPWNMAVARRGGPLLVWDWERFETDVPARLDALHYVVQTTTVGRTLEPELILDSLALARAVTSATPVDCQLYLVAVLTRYLALLDQPGGTHLLRRATPTLVAAERLTAGAGSRQSR